MLSRLQRIRHRIATYILLAMLTPILIVWSIWIIILENILPFRPPRSRKLAFALTLLQSMFALYLGWTTIMDNFEEQASAAFTIGVRYDIFSICLNMFMIACLEAALLGMMTIRIVHIAVSQPLMGLLTVVLFVAVFL